MYLLLLIQIMIHITIISLIKMKLMEKIVKNYIIHKLKNMKEDMLIIKLL